MQKVGSSQGASQSSNFTGQSSQGSSHPEGSSSQPAPTTPRVHVNRCSSQPAPTVCDDTTRVKRVTRTTISSQSTPIADTSILVTRGITNQLPPRRRESARQKRGRAAAIGSSNAGICIYTSASGTQILNPGTSSQRILSTGSAYKDASSTGVDLGFKARGLRWKNNDAVTTSQLQQMANKKKKK